MNAITNNGNETFISYIYSTNTIIQYCAACAIYARMHLGTLLRARGTPSLACERYRQGKQGSFPGVIADSRIKRIARGKYPFYEWTGTNGSGGKREINRREFIVRLNDCCVCCYITKFARLILL